MAIQIKHTLPLGSTGELWPTLGLGTWRFGENARRADSEVAAIRRALEIGYRLFDTAEMYGEGGAEQVLGRALHDAMRQPGGPPRDVLRIVSKAYPHHADAAGLRRACEASRKRLQLDTIDLYLLHWRGSIPLADTVRGFEALQQKGWIRHWGISNFDATDLDELHALPRAEGCAANQVYYSLSERGIEFDLLPRMRKWGMPLMAYCPIDGGQLGANARLVELAGAHGCTAAQLGLAWLLRQTGVMAIPKAGSDAHLLENWRSQDLLLPEPVWAALEEAFPAPTHKRALAMR